MGQRLELRLPGVSTPQPDRNLALELVRVTESAAMGAGRWIGRGDKIAADQAAVDAMRAMLDTVVMDGVVVIGEGEKDEAPMLYNGEKVGEGRGPEVDVAVDPLEGTRLCAFGQPNAIAVIAVAERGSMFFPGAAVYMEKIAVGANAADVIDITASPTENVKAVAKAKGLKPTDIRVVVLRAQPLSKLVAQRLGTSSGLRLDRCGCHRKHGLRHTTGFEFGQLHSNVGSCGELAGQRDNILEFGRQIVGKSEVHSEWRKQRMETFEKD